MKRILSLVTLILIVNITNGQEGSPLLTHFSESSEIENQNWAICQDDNHLMLFANRKGILTFDGNRWVPVKIPIIPFSMRYIPGTGRIYLGGDSNYGYLEKNKLGLYDYVSLSDTSSDLGIITTIGYNSSSVWFYGEKSVSRHNLETGMPELRIYSKKDKSFTGMIITSKDTFINVSDSGLFRIEGDTLFPIVTGYLLEKVEVLFSLPYDKNLVLIGLSNGKLSLFDGIKFYNYNINDEGYLRENILSEGITIGDSLYAFSTLAGGAVIVDKISRKIRNIINTQTDLPDDELFALGIDRSGGLWLSHQYGLTRADLNLPVENFSIFPGLKGNISTSLWQDNELYVATSEGVFFLERVDRFSEYEVLVKEKEAKEIPVAAVTEKLQAPILNQKTRKNIFSRIFGQEEKTKNVVPSMKAVEKDSAYVVPRPADRYKWEKVRRIKSVDYLFRKIEGLNDKCRQLVPTENGILAATNKGLYRIINRKAEIVVRERYINYISITQVNGKYFIGTDNGFFSVKFHGGKFTADYPRPSFNEPVYSVINSDENTLWLGCNNISYRVEFNNDGSIGKFLPLRIVNEFPFKYRFEFINDTISLFTEAGTWFIDPVSSEYIPFSDSRFTAGNETSVNYYLQGQSWIKLGDTWRCLKSDSKITDKEISLLKIFDNVISIDTHDDYLWVIDGRNRLFCIDRKKPVTISPEIDLFVRRIYDESGTDFSLSDIVFNKGGKVIYFEVVAPGFIKQNTTRYQYFVDKLMNDWSPWTLQTDYNMLISKPGQYTLRVRAKDLWGNIGEAESVKFTITAPFTQTTTFYFLSGLSLLLVIIIFFRFREQILRKEKKILEAKVRERTAEIEAQKDQITSSIHYASRIQMAMLPASDHFKEHFPEYFVFFKPRDIVSGDFYWIGENDSYIFVAVADCTGHGVPGAFMSTLGISTLNEIIANEGHFQANTILNQLREKIKIALHQTGKEGEAADGMDMAFLILDKQRKILQYSGAYNPLFIFQAGEFKEYKGDRMPIGIHYGAKDAFTNYEINVKRGDTVYIFSDGFSDQFGGTDGAKYKKLNLKKLLKEIYYRPMDEQLKIIDFEFEKWKGSNFQVDDITLVGFRI